jgi:hypothetical protein
VSLLGKNERVVIKEGVGVMTKKESVKGLKKFMTALSEFRCLLGNMSKSQAEFILRNNYELGHRTWEIDYLVQDYIKEGE